MRHFYPLLFGLLLSLNLSAQNCLDGFSFIGTFGGHHYYLSSSIATGPQAYSIASNLGGYVASITTAAENNWLSVRIPGYIIIGLSDAQTEGNFTWQSGEPYGYSNWWPGEPNNLGNEDYVVTNFGAVGRWNDIPAYVAARFVLELNEDGDQDGILDRCDPCPNDPLNDIDGDGVCGDIDNCPDTANSDQADDDCDGVGNACDLCPGGDDSVDNNNDGMPDCAYYPGFENLSPDWICGKNKVLVCHRPPGNPNNSNTICISKNAVSAHAGHGDFIGPCSDCGTALKSGGNKANSFNHNGMDLDDMTIFPNPASEEINIRIPESELETTVSIYDIQGRIIWTQRISPNAERTVTVNAQVTGYGIFAVVARSGNNSRTDRLVVQR